MNKFQMLCGRYLASLIGWTIGDIITGAPLFSTKAFIMAILLTMAFTLLDKDTYKK